MKQQIGVYFNYLLLLLAAVFLFKVFVVRDYDVPPQNHRANTHFWVLATASKIAYTFVPGKGTKKPYPIVFLQGGPGGFITAKHIELLSELSSDGYEIYLYDQIGSGQSDRLANITEYTAERHKSDLAAICKQLGAEKVILLGQSWGAVLATLFVADHADKVEKLILTGPGPIQPQRNELMSLETPDSLGVKKPNYTNREANSEAQNIRMAVVGFFAKHFGVKLASDREVDDFQTYLNAKLNKATVCDTVRVWPVEGGGGYYVQLMTVRSFDKIEDPRPKLKGLKIPVLLMKGQCDNQAWGFTQEYLELFPNAQLKVVPEAGHVIAIEQPHIYLKTIREFLNGE